MLDSTRQQLETLEAVAQGFFRGSERITVCVGSGISSGRMPMMAELIARGFSGLGRDSRAHDLFRGYSSAHHFWFTATQEGYPVENPCTLDDFCLLPEGVRRKVCEVLCENYGNVFQELLECFDGKQGLLEAIGFQDFQASGPDCAHCYIAFLVIEGKLQRLVSANWDRLIEAAVDKFAPGPPADFLKVVKDEASWIRRHEGLDQLLVKAHGCCHDYPDNCGDIVLTTQDLVRSTVPNSWRQEALRDVFDATVIVTGYSLSDFTFNVAFTCSEQRRDSIQVDRSRRYIFQEADLSSSARCFIDNGPGKHVRLNANDLFSTMFYGWVRAGLRDALQGAHGQSPPERPFHWTDDGWNAALQRVECFLEGGFPEVLDCLLGPPSARDWDGAAEVPVAISNLRRLFLDGKVGEKTKYRRLQFDATKDIVLLLMIVALHEAVRGKAGWRLDPRSGHLGVRLLVPGGGSRQVFLLYGSYPQNACAVLTRYLREAEEAHEVFPSPEIVIIPCCPYQVPDDAGLEPSGILSKRLPGACEIRKRFIAPSQVLNAGDFQGLVAQVATALEV